MKKEYYAMVVFGYEDTNTGKTTYNGYSLTPFTEDTTIFDPDSASKTMVLSDNHRISIKPYSDLVRQSLLTITDMRTKQRIQQRLICNLPDPRFKDLKVPISPSKNLVLLGGVVYIDKTDEQEAKRILSQLNIKPDHLYSHLFEREK